PSARQARQEPTGEVVRPPGSKERPGPSGARVGPARAAGAARAATVGRPPLTRYIGRSRRTVVSASPQCPAPRAAGGLGTEESSLGTENKIDVKFRQTDAGCKLHVSFGIFHRRRRKIMARTALKADWPNMPGKTKSKHNIPLLLSLLAISCVGTAGIAKADPILCTLGCDIKLWDFEPGSSEIPVPGDFFYTVTTDP